MITRTATGWQAEDWQFQLSRIVTSVRELYQHLELPIDSLPSAELAHLDFPLKVPQGFLDKIKKGDVNDPLLLQVLPKKQELVISPGFSLDPLAEASALKGKGLLHKYKSRVLVVLSGSCAINCRYCFRRHFPYQDNGLSQQEFEDISHYVINTPHINEVILSGGDPLITSNKRLERLIRTLEKAPNLKRLRFHSRVPIVIPERIDNDLLRIIQSTHLKIILVTHSNHAQELDGVFSSAMQQLTRIGVTLLNQSVLLKGVNDSVSTLSDLSEKLFDAGVLPYYLHLLDPVTGTSHFDVSETEGKQLIQQLLTELPGYLVPKLVKEEAGKTSKTPISP